MHKPKYIFSLKNVKTYPHKYHNKFDQSCGKSVQVGVKCDDRCINYGDFRISLYLIEEEFEFKHNINWVHPSENINGDHYKDLCLGSDYYEQITDILSNDELNDSQVRKSIEHILNDYFSTCTENHWKALKIPENVKSITNDDLFFCLINKVYLHKSNMCKKVLSLSKDAYDKHNIDIDKNKKSPIKINNFIHCHYCGAYSRPKSTKCFSCSNEIYDYNTLENQQNVW